MKVYKSFNERKRNSNSGGIGIVHGTWQAMVVFCYVFSCILSFKNIKLWDSRNLDCILTQGD